MNWLRAKFREDTWLVRVVYAALGALLAFPPLIAFRAGGSSLYLMVAAGHAIFAFSLWLSVFVNAPSHAARFTDGERFAAKLGSVAGLVVALVGIALRTAA